MNQKTHYYCLARNSNTYSSLRFIVNLIPCSIHLEDNFVLITANENDFSLIDDILTLFS